MLKRSRTKHPTQKVDPDEHVLYCVGVGVGINNSYNVDVAESKLELESDL